MDDNLPSHYEESDFAKLYDRYVDGLFAFIQYKMGDVAAAEDVVSITFEKALKNFDKFEWRNATSFKSWLYRIAHNEMNSWWRKENWLTPLWDIFFSPHNVEETLQQYDIQQVLVQAVKQLSSKDKELIYLRYYEELSNAEISEVMGMSKSNVAASLSRVHKRLRQRMIHLPKEGGVADATSG